MPDFENLTLDIAQSIEINTDLEHAYLALIRRLTVENSTADNQAMPMVLEEWPGGRWFRDLHNQQGHLWGFVQVIKPPTLIEIHGPMFMSYAVASHIQFRLTPQSGSVELSLRHRILGAVEDNHRAGIQQGWGYMLKGVQELAGVR